MKAITAVFCLATIIFVSCQKTGINFVEGTVYESDTKEPINNAKVEMLWTAGHHDWSASARTDSKGYYKIWYDHKRNIKYHISCYLEDHWPGPKYEGIINGNRSKVNMYLDPLAYAKFRIINTTSVQTEIMFISPYEVQFFLKPFQDTLLPRIYKTSGNGITTFHGWYGPSYTNFLVPVEVYSRGATVTQTIYIN